MTISLLIHDIGRQSQGSNQRVEICVYGDSIHYILISEAAVWAVRDVCI